MAFEVEWPDNIARKLEKLGQKQAKRIIDKVEETKDEPYLYFKKLRKYPFHKLTVGNIRVIARIINVSNRISVVLVDHRINVYKEIKKRFNKNQILRTRACDNRLVN